MNLNSSLSSLAVLSPAQIIEDYRLGFQSRHASLIGRKEVLSGKAKFGIFGDGKEVPQLALAHAFQKGDFRSGYYRDQTIAFATGTMTIKQFFAQLYADPSLDREPHSAGRQMNGHFATRSLNLDGSWRNLTEQPNIAADASPTGSQMPRIVGLAQASKLYREVEELKPFTNFSKNGNEIVFGTIGNASCAEGMFFEAINAIGVLQVPAVISVWDDGYGISVPQSYQITKSSISEILKGFQRDENSAGFEIFVVKGWDYPALVETYQQAAKIAREEHVPCLVHVIEVTQPQGHSTSGDHRRYKSKERLDWEVDFDCITKMRTWILQEGIATEEQLAAWEKEDIAQVRNWKAEAWNEYQGGVKAEIAVFVELLKDLEANAANSAALSEIRTTLTAISEPFYKDVMEAAHKTFLAIRLENNAAAERLKAWKTEREAIQYDRYSAYLMSESAFSALKVESVAPVYSENSPTIPGYELLNKCFDDILTRMPDVVAFGEDVGHIGDVNQAFAGLQAKYGKARISDTGIREATIMGQAIGLAMRGLRPIAEIQYLDYLLYGLEILSDDLACLHWRTKGGQKAPAIIRTRGHRLEGIWHAGSPMGMILHSLRGMHVLVPRNMTQAAGFYNTLLKGDEPALMIEVLNGYRLRERLPDNYAEFCLPLGVPEILREGNDITLVTYGANCRLVMEVAEQLASVDIDVEVIDVQTLLPFDIHHLIVTSLKKTNRIVFIDEDVQGGATAFMMQHVLEVQGGYQYLDSQPVTVTSKDHRTAYGTDGDYWSKPQIEHIFRAVYDLMNEYQPAKYPMFY
ncbi:MAG: thiamine pyrophosphate-dependent enzyme [Bacteroidia bacterium]